MTALYRFNKWLMFLFNHLHKRLSSVLTNHLYKRVSNPRLGYLKFPLYDLETLPQMSVT
jgi:hypothetical protein